MKRSFLLISILALFACSENRAPVNYYGGSAGFGSAGAHAVTLGDTIWSISERYNISMQDIVYANNIGPPFILRVGQRLQLPPPQTYKVRAGDSLYTVSRLFNVSSTQLARENNLSPPYRIHPGDNLRLPSIRPEPIRTARLTDDKYDPAPTPGQKPRSDQGESSPEQAPAPKPKSPITKRTPERSSSGTFLKPVEGQIVSSYGPKQGGLHNDGINIGAPKGTSVKAAENGVVVYAGNELKGSGNLILIRHQDRWMTAYAHLDQIKIKRGQTIKRGDIIGTVGQTGSVDKPQLHFELRRGTEAINPERYIKG